MKTLDCRGLECPLPVVKTKEALKEENVVSTIVDNEIAVENLTKFAKVKNYTVNSKKRVRIILLKFQRVMKKQILKWNTHMRTAAWLSLKWLLCAQVM
ncbi:MAG: sulfurtransferase TusA family protein [Holdemanella porci]